MSSDGEALFRAICEQPWEDTPRLVYADWLEENGDLLRAEFIRVQIALARETDWQADRTKDLRARSEALHKQSSGKWTRGSPTQFGIRIDSELRRGFYYSVRFDDSAAFDEFAPAAFAWAPIERCLYRASIQTNSLPFFVIRTLPD